MAGEILSVSEREGLKHDKKDLENILVESDKFGKGTAADSIDKGRLKREIADLDKKITVMPNVNKDKVSRQAKELEKVIVEGMPSEDEMRRPEKHPGAVLKHMHWQSRNKVRIQQWKQMQRSLSPHDPTVSNIEKLRRPR